MRTLKKEEDGKGGVAMINDQRNNGTVGDHLNVNSGSKFDILSAMVGENEVGNDMEKGVFYNGGQVSVVVNVDKNLEMVPVKGVEKRKKEGEGFRKVGRSGKDSLVNQAGRKGKDLDVGKRECKEKNKDINVVKEGRDNGVDNKNGKEKVIERVVIETTKGNVVKHDPPDKNGEQSPMQIINLVVKEVEDGCGMDVEQGTDGNSLLILLNELIDENIVDIVAIMETKRHGDKALSVIKKLKFKGFHKVNIVGYKDGIWLLWDEGRVDMEILVEDFQFIHVRVVIFFLRWFIGARSLISEMRLLSDMNSKVENKNRLFRFLASWMMKERFDDFINGVWKG
ncbi:ribonuclease H [Senna tora]|uniref:Ribonuclease H n=1 Tax=Senna tora TaxID=362788 RepID=A0A835C9Y6_9FABA|nr:ribonuclease H [Senna tora]